MISKITQNGEFTYNYIEFAVDSESDVQNLPTNGIAMGSCAIVISTSEVYMLNSSGEWVKL